MRTLNIRLAIILFVMSAVLGGGAYFLHGYQIKENASMFLTQAELEQQRADEAGAKGDNATKLKALGDAARSLTWYMRLMPDNADVRKRLGMLYVDLSADPEADNRSLNFSRAFRLLEDTVAMDPEQIDTREKLVELSMLAGRFQDAMDHLQDFLLVKDPNNPEYLEQLGQCQMRRGKYDAALTTFRKALEYGPEQVNVYLDIAYLLRSQFSQPDEADQLMEQLVKVNPESSRAHFLRARYLHSTGNPDKALEEITQALELTPDDADVLRLAAICNMANKNIDEARRCAERGIELYPETGILYLTLAEIERRAAQPDAALAAMKQGLKATKRNATLLMRLADFQIDFDKLDDAQETIAELRGVPNFSQPYLHYLLARLEYAKGHWRNAKEGFENVRGSFVTSNLINNIDMCLGDCWGRLGNREQQIKAYSRVLNNDPTNARARAKMTSAYMASGQMDDAFNQYTRLLRDGQAAPASALMLARMLLMKNLRLPPQNRNWEPVEKALEAAEKALPDSPDVKLMRVNVLLGQDRAEEAEKVLREAIDKDPKQSAYWRTLASLAGRRGDGDEAEKILAEAEKALGDTVELRVARAQQFVTRYGKEAADRLHKLAENTDSYSDDQLLVLWSGLINASMQIADDEQTNALCRKIAEKEPDNINIRYLLFERALRNQDREGMENTLKEVERVAGKGAVWLYGQACLMFLNVKDEEDENERNAVLHHALNLLEQARELRGDWSRIPLVEAGIYDSLEQMDVALERYRTAFDMGERNPNGIRRLVQLLLRSRQYAEADMLIRQLEREQPQLSSDLIMAGAEIALQKPEYDRALELARKAVAEDSKNFADHLWLGRMLRMLGMREKAMNQEEKATELLGDAEAALLRAVELKPDIPQTWVALVGFYEAVGEVDKAQSAYEKAKLNISAEEAPMALASIAEAMNKADEAEELYKTAMEADPQDIQVIRAVAIFYISQKKYQSAEALLQRIIDGKVKGDKNDSIWARRQLVPIYISRRGYENLQKARKLCEQNMRETEDTAIEIRILAQLDAADPQRAQRDKAISKIQSLIEVNAATPQDKLRLALMYDAAGEWIKASDLFRELVANYPKEPRFLVAYIEALLKHKEYSSIDMYLDRLIDLAPKWFVTLALQADFLCAKNQSDKALELIKQFVAEVDEEAKDRDARLRMGADKLAQLARTMTQPEDKAVADKYFDQAEAWYRAFVEGQPRRMLLLAMFLGGRGKTSEALDLLEKSLDHSTPQDYAKVCTTISHNVNTDDEQSNRLDAVIDKAADKFERHPSILMSLAEFRGQRRNYDEAEKLYREVIEKYPDNPVAMNNLAVLLALQGADLDGALKMVNRAIEMAGPLGAMLDSRASVYLALGESEKAIEDITAAVNDSDTPVRLFHQARAFKMAGRFDEAKAAWEKALEKGLTPEMLQLLELPAYEQMKISME